MKKFFISLIVLGLIGSFIYVYVDYNYLNKSDEKDSPPIPKEIKDELEDLGYTKDDIKSIREKLNEEEIDSIDELQNKEYLTDYVNIDYFKLENLSRYVEYDKINDYSKEDVVMYVNIGMDNAHYTNIITVDNPYDTLVLVNKYRALPSGIEPQNLFTSDESYNPSSLRMEKIASDNLSLMFASAKENGYDLYLDSGYRPESYQRNLYNYYVSIDGQEEADTYSARPNHSEHQTGLAADIGDCPGCMDYFANSDAYPWVLENAHKFGFIERYPKNKEYITGYDYEPWHYRYVGIEVATIIHNEEITFEEYYVKYIENKN